jgi:hypothetical protein
MVVVIFLSSMRYWNHLFEIFSGWGRWKVKLWKFLLV